MPKVLNKKIDIISKNDVYIGKPTMWSNPFVIGEFNREEAVSKYRIWIMSQPELIARVKKDLKNKNLVCFCAPKACHGDVLLEIANN